MFNAKSQYDSLEELLDRIEWEMIQLKRVMNDIDAVTCCYDRDLSIDEQEEYDSSYERHNELERERNDIEEALRLIEPYYCV